MFSVVIPLYNKAHIIKKTVASVLSQTFQDFELLIVNDGSTDNSVAEINNLTSDSRIRIIDQANQGVSVARNRGVKESKFKYIAFLDGDDEWFPDFLSAIKQAIEKYPTAGLYGTSSLHRDFVVKNDNDSTILKYKNNIVKVDCFKNVYALPHTSAIVVRKGVLYKIDQDLEVFPIGMKACEDWSCFYRVALTEDLIYIGIPLGIRNNNVEGQITQSSESDRDKLHPDGVRYYNLVYNYWVKENRENKSFFVFIKYNLRHSFKVWLKGKKWNLINLYVSGLDEGILSQFERTIFKNKSLRRLNIIYINSTKIYAKGVNFLHNKMSKE